ncbi:hypothetical protein HGM15179_019286 [Zosterops borbonicus]|uniref:Uncharacterized protein n=1 Tax=Zosterops borbonicus TaxID=364589 RepID=A0A8K1D911_9PASS|nr:hypothetical protein HGM15179_019286 [Zosterops borbonicus]
MEKRPPRRPRVAWEEAAASQESSSAEEPYEVTMVQPLQPNAGWVPVDAREAVDFIQAFASSPQQFQYKYQKLKFLDSICTLCRDAKANGFSQDLDNFCCRYKLGAIIQTLNAMDTMLEVMVLNSPASKIKILQDILEV